MKVRPIPAEVLNAYVAGLTAFVPGLTSTKFVSALRSFEPDLGEGEGAKRRPPPRMLTLADAADALAVSVCTIRRMVRDGRMAGRKIGKQWRIPATAIESLAEVRGG
jgi:excisionase family DNA binding protein